jgi:hypothetical protein
VDGERFLPGIVAHRTGEGLAITALVVLCENPAEKLAMPYELFPILSKSLFDAGDVVTAIAAT